VGVALEVVELGVTFAGQGADEAPRGEQGAIMASPDYLAVWSNAIELNE